MAEKKIKKALNLFERFIIRRIVKKFVKKLPDLKNEALEIIETKETVLKFVQEYENK